MELRTRLVAGALIVRAHMDGTAEPMLAKDGRPREWTGPSEDFAIMEADRWLRNRYEVKMQDTVQ